MVVFKPILGMKLGPGQAEWINEQDLVFSVKLQLK